MFDVLILNSGSWVLAEELSATPWHILIYRQQGEPSNELHVWLPKNGKRGSAEFAFRRYWVDGETRWCVELPLDPDRMRSFHARRPGLVRFRFTAPGERVLWADYRGFRRLGDFTDAELVLLRRSGSAGPYYPS